MNGLGKSAKQLQIEQQLATAFDAPAFVGPTMTNPDKLKPTELREALQRANDDLLCQALRINNLEAGVSWVSNILAKLCELQLAGLGDELNDELERLSAHYQTQKAAMTARRMN